jgi:hypothetical protein
VVEYIGAAFLECGGAAAGGLLQSDQRSDGDGVTGITGKLL